jgi:hypothetical protein
MDYANFAALLIGVALVPGIPADGLYGYIRGVDRRERIFTYLLRIFLFSTAGLVTAWLLSIAIGHRVVHGVVANTHTFAASDPADVLLLYLGQCLFAIAIAGVSAALITRYDLVVRDTWDRFVSKEVPNRWVLVTLVSGTTYAGRLKAADVEAAQRERDVMLEEPAIYRDEIKNYELLPYRSLFLKASLIATVAVVYNDELDKATRTTKVGDYLFPKRDEHEHRESTQHPAASGGGAGASEKPA